MSILFSSNESSFLGMSVGIFLELQLFMDTDNPLCRIHRIFINSSYLSLFTGIVCCQFDMFFALYNPLQYKEYVTKKTTIITILVVKEWV